MLTAKIIFLIIVAIAAIFMAFAHIFFPESSYKGREQARIRNIVKMKMICFLVVLVMILLCVVL